MTQKQRFMIFISNYVNHCKSITYKKCPQDCIHRTGKERPSLVARWHGGVLRPRRRGLVGACGPLDCGAVAAGRLPGSELFGAGYGVGQWLADHQPVGARPTGRSGHPGVFTGDAAGLHALGELSGDDDGGACSSAAELRLDAVGRW